MRVACHRRLFLSFVLAATLGTACGVKGPLYLPPEPEPEKEKKKEEEKTSRREAAPANADHS